MPYPAKAIANFFIKKAKEEGDRNLNLMKLLKLIYMAHGWSLAFFDKPLINESIEAWKYGPVVSNVYHALKHYAFRPIHDVIKEYSYDDKGVLIKETYDFEFDDKTRAFLENVWDTYRRNTGIQLSNWSHNTDGPWYKSWHLEEGYKRPSVPILNQEIQKYFKEQGKVNDRDHPSHSDINC